MQGEFLQKKDGKFTGLRGKDELVSREGGGGIM